MDSKKLYLDKLKQMGIMSDEGAAHLNLYRKSDANTANYLEKILKEKYPVDKTRFRGEESLNIYKKSLEEQDYEKDVLDYNMYINKINRKIKEKNAEIEKKKKSRKWWE
jgi:hypothetical protein